MELYSSSLTKESKYFNRFERYDMLNEEYTESNYDRKRYEPHKSIPIRKMKVKTIKKDDFIFELIHKFNRKKEILISDDENKIINIGDINQEISDYLQNIFIRSLWMINRNIGRCELIYSESLNYSIRESLNILLGDVINFEKDDEDYYTVIDIFMNKIYRLDEKIIESLIAKYSISRYSPFIYHLNLYIKTNLVE
jgi:hypothetical protein